MHLVPRKCVRNYLKTGGPQTKRSAVQQPNESQLMTSHFSSHEEETASNSFNRPIDYCLYTPAGWATER